MATPRTSKTKVKAGAKSVLAKKSKAPAKLAKVTGSKKSGATIAKAAPKKAASTKAATKAKPAAKKASKPAARKATPVKAGKAPKSGVAAKASPKKAAPAKPIAKKGASAKPVAKKTVTKKASEKKTVATKATLKKAAPTKSVAKKAVASKAPAKTSIKPVATKAVGTKPIATKAAPVSKKVAKPVVQKSTPTQKKSAPVKPEPKKVVSPSQPKAAPSEKTMAAKPTVQAPKSQSTSRTTSEKFVPKPAARRPEASEQPTPLKEMTDKKSQKLPETKPNKAPAVPEKTRYSDSELQEFDMLIDQKLIIAREQLEFYLKQLEEFSENPDNKIKGLDDGLVTIEVERLTTQAARQQKLIQHLDNAKIRIKNKVYGICRETGKLISKERLRAVPHATLSIEAKQSQQ